MAKITNLEDVRQMAATILDENDYDLVDRIGRDNAIWCLVAIYTTNDICKGYGQDFVLHYDESMLNEPWKISVISFATGVSLIIGSESTRYQDRFPMCGYEDLHDDLYQIAIDIQACFDKIQ